MTKIGIIGLAGSGQPVRLLNPGIDIYSFDLTKPLELTFFRKNGKVVVIQEIMGYFYPLGEMLRQVDGPIFVSVPERCLPDVFEQIHEAIPSYPYELQPPPPIIALPNNIPFDKFCWLRKKHSNMEIYLLEDFQSKIIIEGERMGTTIFQRTTELEVVALQEPFGCRELI